MIIRKELEYENTFIRGDVIDFEKGYSKHGTFLKINNRIIDCGYIEENNLNAIGLKSFVTMGESNRRLEPLKDLVRCEVRLYYLMTSEQKRELEEAKKKRFEGKLDEALKLHIYYCINNRGRIEGEVYEELSRLMVAMGYYDLGLCFLSLANLSEIQVYSDDTVLKNNKDNFDKLKKVVEYQYKEEIDEEEKEKSRRIIKEFAGEYTKYSLRLAESLNFESKKFLIEFTDTDKNIKSVKYEIKGKILYITSELMEGIEKKLKKEKTKVSIDEQEFIYEEGELYKSLIEKVMLLKNY